MKLFNILVILILCQNCSFDNKTGIWKNENSVLKKNKGLFQEFETLSLTKDAFNKIVPLNKNFKFKLPNKINSKEWPDIFYNQSNNYKNFNYSNLNQIIYKSKKKIKNNVNPFILYENNNVISTDEKGNIVVFSVKQNKIINKFNFYKKKYKKINKVLNLIIENQTIYVSDNIGYLYAYNYKKNKILWAKNYKKPFRSNLKIVRNKLVAANQNNNLYFIDKQTGVILKLIPTEETLVKNQFINNLSVSKKFVFFLNTYGSLYAINNQTMSVAWFINLNQSLDINPSNLFLGNQITNDEKKIVVSTNFFTYVLDINTGSIIYKVNFSSLVKPLMVNNYLFSVTKNNLLVSFNMDNGSILYSYNINQKIAEFLNINKKKVKFNNLFLANNKLFIFLKNSYVLEFNINGNIDNVIKLPSKINSHPLFIDKSLLFLNNKNKIIIVN
jgi:outer membrane protein assembly factor BamB